MNALLPWQRERILKRLREGASLRRIERETGHRHETISRYAREAGCTNEQSPHACLGRLARARHVRRASRRPRVVVFRRA